MGSITYGLLCPRSARRLRGSSMEGLWDFMPPQTGTSGRWHHASISVSFAPDTDTCWAEGKNRERTHQEKPMGGWAAGRCNGLARRRVECLGIFPAWQHIQWHNH